MAVTDSRVLLVRHAPTPATRDRAFPADEALDADARAAARKLREIAADHVVVSPLRRCHETAEAAGWSVDAVDPRWAELDFGAWAGRSYAEVAGLESDALAVWHADPAGIAPPRGETAAALADRTARALADIRDRAGTTVVVTSGGPVKVAVLHALAAPLTQLWNLEVAPLSVTELRPRPGGGWTLSAGVPAAAHVASAVTA